VPVGVLPLVVYQICAPVVVVESVTDCAPT
jgi:hypothetical protein